MSDLLLARAHSLGGVFSSADASADGVSRNALRSLVAAGSVVRVAPRAHVLAQALAAARTPEAVHRLHTLAVLRSFDGRVAASHHSALALHGLPFWRVDTSTFHVCRVVGRSSRVRGTLHVHESTRSVPLLRLRATGALTVPPGLAAVGTAIVDGVEAGVVAMDAALHRGLVRPEDLDGLVSDHRCVPGVTRARTAALLAEASAESPGESRTRLLLRQLPAGLVVEPQAVVRDPESRFVARCDFLVGGRVVVEFDGRAKYGLSGTREDDLWAEKLREDRLRALGYLVVRLTWQDLADPAAVLRRVWQALRVAGAG